MIFNKTSLQILLLLLAISCSYPPIEKKKLYYSKDKIEVFYQSRDILKKLGYEIDIFSPESYALSTKKTQIKKTQKKHKKTQTTRKNGKQNAKNNKKKTRKKNAKNETKNIKKALTKFFIIIF